VQAQKQFASTEDQTLLNSLAQKQQVDLQLPSFASGSDDSLFVWSEQNIAELSKKDGDMKRKQLNVIAYLWEFCYDLLLATDENVSVSPGFEAFGLRVNR